MKRALLVGLVICALGALGYGVERALELRAATEPPTPEAFVQASWTVYRHAPGHRVHVGTQGLPCTECHEAAHEGSFDEPGPGVCLRCHEDRAGIVHMRTHVDDAGHRVAEDYGGREMTDCLRCHGFGPDPAQQSTDCLACHAQPKGELPAVVTHAREACTSCHDVHENRVQPIACQTCHTLSVDHGAHLVGSPEQCLDCHSAHGTKDVAVQRCASCHAAPATNAVPATASAGQHTCTGCHAPHGFSAREVRSCTSCHDGQKTLRGTGHKACAACHESHAARASVERQNVCLGCHQQVSLDHPMPLDAPAACTGCHDPHPPAEQRGPATCTSCHKQTSLSDLTAHAPGVSCTGCHAPHGFARTEAVRARCTECHGKRIAALAQHAGHADCKGCHTALPHGGIVAPTACASCHAERAAGAHRGHQRCTGCHDAHSGALPAQPCSGCHAQQVQTLSPKHGACQGCHEPHAATQTPEVSACVGCHQPAQLPGLHEVAEHRARCASCHAAHPTQRPAERMVCLSCHRDREDHQPTATQCSGCHAFRAPPKLQRSP